MKEKSHRLTLCVVATYPRISVLLVVPTTPVAGVVPQDVYERILALGFDVFNFGCLLDLGWPVRLCGRLRFRCWPHRGPPSNHTTVRREDVPF